MDAGFTLHMGAANASWTFTEKGDPINLDYLACS